MKTINHIVKRNIVSNIMSVIQDSFPHDKSSIGDPLLEKKLFKAIDSALINPVQTEKKVVNILLSDLRGFVSMA